MIRKKNKNKNKILFFVVLLGAGGPAELLEVACDEKKLIFLLLFLYFIFLFLFIFPFRLNPTDIRGVKPWEPPHLLPPTPISYLLTSTSYLYYYITLLMSLISLFFFALTFGKPLNYLTCGKEDF
jgi:hypothetical protein